MIKKCKRCKIEKDTSKFAKYRYKDNLLYKATCQECYKPNLKSYYSNNRENIITKNSNYKKNNRININSRERIRKRNDSGYKLYSNVRSLIKISIKRKGGNKNKLSSIKYLSYSIKELKCHLEKQFEPWMNWDNHGKYNVKTWKDEDQSTWTWQIDHIIPQSDLKYDSMNHENFKKCWALENLRPLSAKQNIIDGSTRNRHLKETL